MIRSISGTEAPLNRIEMKKDSMSMILCGCMEARNFSLESKYYGPSKLAESVGYIRSRGQK